MAKSWKSGVSNTGSQDLQEEMTVVILRVKGDGDTLRKGFDALNNAFASLGQVQTATGNGKRLANGATSTKQPAATLANAEDEKKPILMRIRTTDQLSKASPLPGRRENLVQDPSLSLWTNLT